MAKNALPVDADIERSALLELKSPERCRTNLCPTSKRSTPLSSPFPSPHLMTSPLWLSVILVALTQTRQLPLLSPLPRVTLILRPLLIWELISSSASLELDSSSSSQKVRILHIPQFNGPWDTLHRISFSRISPLIDFSLSRITWLVPVIHLSRFLGISRLCPHSKG